MRAKNTSAHSEAAFRPYFGYEHQIYDTLARYLLTHGFCVATAADLRRFMRRLETTGEDHVVLAVMRPDSS